MLSCLIHNNKIHTRGMQGCQTSQNKNISESAIQGAIPDAFPSILGKMKFLATGTSGPSSHHLSPMNTYN